eukprot:gene9524-biopygen5928
MRMEQGTTDVMHLVRTVYEYRGMKNSASRIGTREAITTGRMRRSRRRSPQASIRSSRRERHWDGYSWTDTRSPTPAGQRAVRTTHAWAQACSPKSEADACCTRTLAQARQAHTLRECTEIYPICGAGADRALNWNPLEEAGALPARAEFPPDLTRFHALCRASTLGSLHPAGSEAGHAEAAPQNRRIKRRMKRERAAGGLNGRRAGSVDDLGQGVRPRAHGAVVRPRASLRQPEAVCLVHVEDDVPEHADVERLYAVRAAERGGVAGLRSHLRHGRACDSEVTWGAAGPRILISTDDAIVVCSLSPFLHRNCESALGEHTMRTQCAKAHLAREHCGDKHMDAPFFATFPALGAGFAPSPSPARFRPSSGAPPSWGMKVQPHCSRCKGKLLRIAPLKVTQ